MSNDTYRLIYYSRSRLAGGEAAVAAEIRAILAVSRSNNQSAGITGALLFSAGGFGQVLEGPRQAVEATFERVQRDPRHGDVALLAFEPVAARTFTNWSMAFIGEERLQTRYRDIAAGTGFDPSRLAADQLFETLRAFTIEEDVES